jgi:hypothetical protein
MPRNVTLSGVEVIDTTRLAVCVAWSAHSEDHTAWIPRSLCDDGDTLEAGDKDVVVATWFADKEGLPYA